MSAVLTGTVLLTAVGLFSQGMGLLYRIALSRLLGAEGMGLYQLLMPLYSVLLSLSAVGLTAAVSTLTAHLHARRDEGAVQALLRRALGLFLLAAVPLGAAVVCLSDPISVYLLGDARTRLGLALLAPCVLLTGVENLHKHCFYGLEQVGAPALSETLEQIIRTGAVLGLLLLLRPRTLEGRVGAVAAGMTVCEVCSAALLTLLLRRRWRRTAAGPRSEGPGYSQLLRIALPVGLTALLGNLLGAANAVLIPAGLTAGGMTAGQAMSAFGVLCGMTMPMLAVPTAAVSALCLTLVPSLARRAALGDLPSAGRLLDRALGASSVLLAPAMALLAVLGPAIGRAVYREAGVGAWMPALAAGTLLGCWQAIFSGALNALGQPRRAAFAALTADGLQLAFTALTVRRWGLGGYVAGFVFSSLLGAALALAAVLRRTGLATRWYHWFLRPVLAAGLAGLCCSLLLSVLERSGSGTLRSGLIAGGLGLIVYAAALLAQGTAPGDYLPPLRRRVRL